MFYIELIVLVYFTFVVGYGLVFSTSASLRAIKSGPIDEQYNKIAVLIPAYKEDSVIVDIAKEALNQNYPAVRFDIIVIADSFQDHTLNKLYALPITTIKVAFENSTKVSSLNKALSILPEQYDIAVILDADNLMERDFLLKINSTFNQGYKAIQGRRVAKNLNTSLAILDAISESINNHILRKGATALGLSSSLNGSGMAFDYQLLKSTLSEMNCTGGFDRELELKLMECGYKSVFIDNALVYDEKVEKAEVFKNQRRRWISSQFMYLKKYFFTGLKRSFHGDISYFNSAVMRNIQLPRMLNLGLLTIWVLVAVLLDKVIYDHIWIGLFCANLLSISLAVPFTFYNKKTFIALVELPKVFFIMFFLLFRLKGANQTFIHTPHGDLEVVLEEHEEVL